uniref:Anamorsin n=1 Tax=Lygus hesperus TaxID=30085 RepID=A0A146M284_LYGHE
MTELVIQDTIEETLKAQSGASIASLVLDFSKSSEQVSSQILEHSLRVLQLDGKIKIIVPAKQTHIRRLFILNGFSSIHSDTSNSDPDIKIFLATKPDFTGVSVTLDGKVEVMPADSVWTLDIINNIDVDNTKDNQMISEFDLVQQDIPKPTYGGTSDQPKKRRACKNCTCG